MELFQLRIFQRQVLDQSKYVLMSANLINSSLKNKDQDGVWFALQSFLTASANIAKMLWGSGARLASQREDLRTSLGVDDNSPFRDVSMRNHFEHMDERIDRWWEKSENHNHFDQNIGPIGMFGNPADIDMFRMFDPETTEVRFWGESVSLQQVVDEIHKILPKLQREAAKPHWQQ